MIQYIKGKTCYQPRFNVKLHALQPPRGRIGVVNPPKIEFPSSNSICHPSSPRKMTKFHLEKNSKRVVRSWAPAGIFPGGGKPLGGGAPKNL